MLVSKWVACMWGYARQRGLPAAQICVGCWLGCSRCLCLMPRPLPRALGPQRGPPQVGHGSVQGFLAQAALPSAMQQASVGSHLRHLIQMAHEPSWFTTHGLETPAASTRGSKAGARGGYIFAFAMVGIWGKISAALAEAGLVDSGHFAQDTQVLRSPVPPGAGGHVRPKWRCVARRALAVMLVNSPVNFPQAMSVASVSVSPLTVGAGRCMSRCYRGVCPAIWECHHVCGPRPP